MWEKWNENMTLPSYNPNRRGRLFVMNHPDLPKKPGKATSSKKLNPATKVFGYNPLMVALLTEEVAYALHLAFASPIKDRISYEYLQFHAPTKEM